MSKTLIEFYKDIIESIGLHTTDDGFVYAGTPDNKQLLNADGKFLVLPTRDHIDTLFTQDEDGNITVGKVLFNPLKEDALKGNTVSFSKCKYFVETKLSHSLYIAGELLLTLANKPDLQKKSSFEINKFLSRLNEANNTGIKELVDEKSITNWGSIYKKILNTDTNIVTIYSKKMGKYGGNTYNRTAVLKSDLYTDLLAADKDTPVYEVKLRNKELIILRLLIEFLLPGIEEKPNTIVVGSNDSEAPSFVSLMVLYVRIATRLNKIINDLKKINAELYESGYTPLSIDEEEISNSFIHKADVVLIPDEVDTNRKLRAQENALSGPVANNPTMQQQQQLPIGYNPQGGVPVNAPIQQPMAAKHIDPVDRLLSETGYTPMAVRSEIPTVPSIPNFNQAGGGYMVQPINRSPLTGVNLIQYPMPQGYNYAQPNVMPPFNPQAYQNYVNGVMPNPMMGNYNNQYQPRPTYAPPVSGIRTGM